MVWLAKHVKRAPDRSNVFFLSLMSNEPKMPTPQWVNGRFSFNLLYRKSAIICSPTLPLSLLQVAHLKITLFTAELPCITHYPEGLISLRVMFLLLCAVFWWHRLINKSVTLPLFGRMIGWVTFSLRVDFSSFPTTLKFHSCQWMDSSCQLFHILFYSVLKIPCLPGLPNWIHPSIKTLDLLPSVWLSPG